MYVIVGLVNMKHTEKSKSLEEFNTNQSSFRIFLRSISPQNVVFNNRHSFARISLKRMSIISKIQKQSFKSGSNGGQDIFEEKVDKKPLILSEESEDQYEADVEKFKEGFSEPALKR